MAATTPVQTSDEILLSSDGHVAEPVDLWELRLPDKYKDQAPRFPNIKYGQHNHARLGGRDPIARLADMAIDGVSAEVLYPTIATALYKIPDHDLEEACARAYNDWMIEYCSAAPDRLWGQSMITLWNVDHAIEEMERTKKAGMVGATIWLIPPADLPFSSPHYERFWAAAQDMDMPVSMHINAGHGHYLTRGNLTPFTRQHQSVNWNKFGAMTSLTEIICSGVLERYPRLKVILSEIQVGWIPFWLNESDDWFQTQPIEELELPPSDYFWRQVYATFIDDRVGCYLMEKWGQDNFMWSSDYPHVNGLWPTSREIIARSMSDLPEQTRRKVLCDTVAHVYNKPVPTPIEPPAAGVKMDDWSRRAQFQR
jgi:predicted TIM-barrel fold metal-dependent hydrolase